MSDAWACVACGDTGNDILLTEADWRARRTKIEGGGFGSVVRCVGCGLVQVSNRYFPILSVLRGPDRRTLRRRILRLTAAAPGARYLDIDDAPGLSADEARNAGLFATSATLKGAKELAGVGSKYDLVNCGGMLARSSDPRGLLQMLSDLCAPLGIVFVGVPDTTHWLTGVTDTGRIRAVLPHARVFYDAKTLGVLGRAAGLSVRIERRWPFELMMVGRKAS